MAGDGWRARIALELRYDGPIPDEFRPRPGLDESLRRRMRLHRRLALDFARQAARQVAHPGDGRRALALLAAERRAHSRLARLLGAALRSR